MTHPDQPVLGLELLLALLIIVNHAETLARSTTKLGLHPENDHSLGIGLVQCCELLGEFSSGDIGSGRVKNGEDELLSV